MGRGWKGALLEKDWVTWKPVNNLKRGAFWTVATILGLPIRIPYEISMIPTRIVCLNNGSRYDP
jgi:hypothetical protein